MKIILSCFLLILTQSAVAESELTTTAERSGWKRTGRYDETVRLCGDIAKRHPTRTRCITFGTTPEGRPLVALAVSSAGSLDPQSAKAANKPVLFFQGGIHAGEIDGKDAGFLVLRELLADESPRSPLGKVVVLFVPVFNVDGHERFSPNNRPNQVGPEEMGWRTTAANLNLNRDYAKAEAPEMRSMLRFLNEWDPILHVDLHVTDGAHFQHVIAVMTQPSLEGPAELRKAGASLNAAMMERLKPHLPLPFYPSFIKEDDPSSGFEVGVAPPRFSQAYWGTRNRLGVLVETHSWKDYATRVKATADTVRHLVELGAERGADWRKAAERADRESAKIGGKNVALTYGVGKRSRTIAFQGYAYKRELSPVSGALMTTYDTTKPQVWNVPLFNEIEAGLSVAAPRAGYLVPAAHAAWMTEKLETHGIAFRRIDRPLSGTWEAFRATETSFSAKPYEGRQRLEVKGKWLKENDTLEAGAIYVPIDQPRSRLVLQLLEPTAPDSLLAWGFFNAAFEMKEYMEPYVAEEVARQMLRDTKVAREFRTKVETDPAFAKDPEARLGFFYRRHPSFDVRYNRYPVLRADRNPL